MQSRTVKKKFLISLGTKLIGPTVNVLCKTLKIEETNKSQTNRLIESNQNIVFAFWHGTMLVPWYVLRKFSPNTIISNSKDGDLLVKVLEKWNYKVKRGSSTRGGKEVLDELISEANKNNSIVITPDGPRGPQKIMKAGGVIIAKKAQIPLVLVGICYSKKIKLNSWDKFEIPFFFSRVNIIYSEPIYIDKDLTYDATDSRIKQLSERLNEIQIQAERMC